MTEPQHSAPSSGAGLMAPDTAVQPRDTAGSNYVIDLFAGPGGWSEGLRYLGLHRREIGVEWDEWACRTRRAAGHVTIRADVSEYPVEPFIGKTWGLIASPPCPDWSLAGSGSGRDGKSGGLIDEVPRWVEALRPEWIACEQVPPALPVWQEFARRFADLGYSCWAGVLNAADYGVPQTRERAILMASRVRVAAPPRATHAERPMADLFGGVELPWVSMAEALGWPEDVLVEYQRGEGMIGRHGPRPGRRGDQPCFTLRAGAYGETFNFRVRTGTNTMKHSRRVEDMVPYERSLDRPAPTVDCKASHAWSIHGGETPVKFTIKAAAHIQGFRAGYPFQGNKTKQSEQVGNAVPPPLAMHVVAAVSGAVPVGYRGGRMNVYLGPE